jgi:transposase
LSRISKISREEVQLAREIIAKEFISIDCRAALVTTLMADGKYTAKELSERFSISERTVFEDISRIKTITSNHDSGQDDICLGTGQWGGRRHSLLEPEVEKKFFESLIPKAVNGEILTISEVQQQINNLVGKRVSKTTVYNMMRRNGFRRLMPDTRHPKGDPEKQEEFKSKTLPDTLKSLKKTITKPICLAFMDEARFGRMSNPRRCWCPKDQRAKTFTALVREYKYVFGAVFPKSGDLDCMVAPDMRTPNMSKFLKQISRAHKNEHIVLVCDGASTHKAKDLIIPDNITIVILPAYSPELNPTEYVWKILRAKSISNRYFETLSLAMQAVKKGISVMKKNKKGIISLTCWPWISKIL